MLDIEEFLTLKRIAATARPLRDAEVIAAANRMNLAMLFTGVRHFRH